MVGLPLLEISARTNPDWKYGLIVFPAILTESSMPVFDRSLEDLWQ